MGFAEIALSRTFVPVFPVRASWSGVCDVCVIMLHDRNKSLRTRATVGGGGILTTQFIKQNVPRVLVLVQNRL